MFLLFSAESEAARNSDVNRIRKDKLNYIPAPINRDIEREFVIIIPSYNNEKACEENLESVLIQTYKNYRIIFIDDASTDQTFEIVSNYIKKNGLEERTQLIQNKKNIGAMHNFYNGYHLCKDHEIIVTLDGDDLLAHKDVLAKLNMYYQNDDVWVTYGQFRQKICKKIGFAAPIPLRVLAKSNYRGKPFVMTHLRSFYAALAKRIAPEQMKVDGKFLQVSYDLGMMYPLVEMAHVHTFFIPEVLLTYNDVNPLSECRYRSQDTYHRTLKGIAAKKPCKAVRVRYW